MSTQSTTSASLRLAARFAGPLAALALLAATAACGSDEDDDALPGYLLVGRTHPASKAECPYGGVVQQRGLDTNRNGTLEDEELGASLLLCDDAPTKVRLVVEPFGPRCPSGGTVVLSGRDLNLNEQLDDSEIERTEVTCDARLLTRIRVEPEGARCFAGGVALQAGRDRNRDLTLDDAEVEATEVQCGTVLARSAKVLTAADVAALARITRVEGDLIIGDAEVGTALVAAAFPALRSIAGSLRVDGAAQLASVSFPVLASIGEHLEIGKNTSLPMFAALELPVLDELGGDFLVNRAGALVALQGPRLRFRGSINVSANPMLETFSATSDQPATFVIVAQNPKLAQVALAAPRFSNVSVVGSPLLSQVQLSVDQMVGTLTLQTGTTVVPSRVVQLVHRDAAATAPISILGGATFAGAITQLTIGAQRLRVTGELALIDTRITELRNLDRVDGGLVLSRNALLRTMGPIARVDGRISLSQNDELRDLDFLDQTEVTGDLVLVRNPRLTSVQGLFGQLQRVRGSVDVSNNLALEELESPVQQVDGELDIGLNGALRRLRLDQLVSSFDLFISSNDALLQLSLPALANLTGNVFVHSNDALSLLSLPALLSASRVQVQENPTLPTCHATSLCQQLSLTGEDCIVSGNLPGSCP